MKKLKSNRIIICFLVILSVIYFSINNSDEVTAEGMSFSVVPLLPENQIDNNKSYFDLKMSINQTQEIQVKLINNTDRDLVVDVSANTATTSDNGVAVYGPRIDKKRDSSLEISFSDIVELYDSEININANGSEIVTLKINMPDKEFDGILLGGLQFTERSQSEEVKKNKNQSKNKFSYVLGVSLRETERKIVPKLECNNVYIEQQGYRNMIKINLQNIQPEIIRDLKVQVKVFKGKDVKLLLEEKKSNMRMVPNSNFDFPIIFNKRKLDKGHYRIEVIATAENRVYTWTKYLIIKSDQIKRVNFISVDQKNSSSIRLIIVCVLIVVLAIFFIIAKVKTDKNR